MMEGPIQHPAFDEETLRFLDDLAQNNDRAWFASQKSRYETHVKGPSIAVADALCDGLGVLTGTPHRSKIYRIHRDLRFSKDKTPYNSHVHMSFAAPEHGAAMWFFGLGRDRLSVGCGVPGFAGAALARFRDRMAGPDGAALIALENALVRDGARIGAPDLKTVPRGFARDHPHARALRRKGFGAWIDAPDRAHAASPDLVPSSLSAMERLLPVYRFFGFSEV